MREAVVARWRKRLERFESSGQSAAAFCREEGVSTPSFYKWRKRLGKAAATPSLLSFIEVEPTQPVVFEVVLRSGTVVRVPERHSADALTQLLEVLERRG